MKQHIQKLRMIVVAITAISIAIVLIAQLTNLCPINVNNVSHGFNAYVNDASYDGNEFQYADLGERRLPRLPALRENVPLVFCVAPYFADARKKSAGTKITARNEEQILWNFLLAKIGNEYGVAGLMGNLYAESALHSNNLQNTYERRLGHTDESYTAAVDNGLYKNFVRDSAGYGLAQWTHWSRKQGLLEYAQSTGKSIGDIDVQMEYLFNELETDYASVLNVLKSAKSVFEASTYVLIHFEAPANQSRATQYSRAACGEAYYKIYRSPK